MCHARPPSDQLHPSLDDRSGRPQWGKSMSDHLSTGTTQKLKASLPRRTPLRPNHMRRRRRSPSSCPEMERVACPKQKNYCLDRQWAMERCLVSLRHWLQPIDPESQPLSSFGDQEDPLARRAHAVQLPTTHYTCGRSSRDRIRRRE
ncbi:hypothetical protein LY76DRAFT_236306 [Colletotrichum caudatum]|nr:hypothetical protein LY76DRAFT_236306 [Colletotrichum caudatum]